MIALKVAVHNEFTFMVDEVLDGRAFVTPQILEFLIREEQFLRLINMIVIPRDLADRAQVPKYLDVKDRQYKLKIRKIFSSSRKKNPLGDPESER